MAMIDCQLIFELIQQQSYKEMCQFNQINQTNLQEQHNNHILPMQKQKNPTNNLKKIATSIQSNRKNIQASNQTIHNINELKSNFSQIQTVIRGQTHSIDGIKTFSKESTTETSKNLQSKRAFTSIFEKYKHQIKKYIQLASQHFVISYKDSGTITWQKLSKDLQKLLLTIQQESQTVQQMFEAVQKLSSFKENIFTQLLKLMIYQKNILWRDLNAPYDDYIHGEVKAVINQIKSNEEKLGYIPSKLKFELPKMTIESKNDTIELFKVHLGDFTELVQGLKNYSKLSGQAQVIEDISKNQHIVKGLRERIQKLSINYESLMEKYRNLQISKGKLTPNEQKSLTQKVQEYESIVIRKENQIIEMKQAQIKSEATVQSLRDKTKQLQEELSKFQKYQMPKIKELENNQKSILDEFVKVKRDLQTYSNIVTVERQQKLKLLDDVKDEKKRVNDLAFILGRERRKIKQLKQQINRKQQIIMELVDQKIPQQALANTSKGNK